MFKSHLKILMDQKNMTIRSFATETGVALRTINRARSDEWIAECRLSTLKRIAAGLGVSVKDLFEEVDENVR
jgi:DNA-binding Xre family transcriptional regulator